MSAVRSSRYFWVSAIYQLRVAAGRQVNVLLASAVADAALKTLYFAGLLG
ncbi:hypothetical protein [Pseudomonas amygdali]|nr:hypothetical protein [Pseudomonas amygdali]KPC00854.1 Unknown protein sequence [Pseudomonas amygdali pv. lachrymans]